MSFRELEPAKPVEVPPEIPPPPKVVFADGICDVCSKTMFEHNGVDCRGNELVLRDKPDFQVQAELAQERAKLQLEREKPVG